MTITENSIPTLINLYFTDTIMAINIFPSIRHSTYLTIDIIRIALICASFLHHAYASW